MPRFGEVLRQLRKRKRLSQDELGALAGVNGQTISNIETDKVDVPRGETYRNIAKALGHTTEELDELWQHNRILLSDSLSAKIREIAGKTGQDPLDWLSEAVDFCAPKPTHQPKGNVRHRTENRRLQQGEGRESNAGGTAR